MYYSCILEKKYIYARTCRTIPILFPYLIFVLGRSLNNSWPYFGYVSTAFSTFYFIPSFIHKWPEDSFHIKRYNHEFRLIQSTKSNDILYRLSLQYRYFLMQWRTTFSSAIISYLYQKAHITIIYNLTAFSTNFSPNRKASITIIINSAFRILSRS